MASDPPAGGDAMLRLGADVWTRFAAFVPVVAWPALASVSCFARDAVLRAGQAEPYSGAELDVVIGPDQSGGFRAMAYTNVRGVRLRVTEPSSSSSSMKLALPATVQALTLLGEAWRMLLLPEACITCHRSLVFLDLTGLTQCDRGDVLEACIAASWLGLLRELRAGSSPTGRESGFFDSMDTVISLLPSLTSATPHLEALDVGYSPSETGLDFDDCVDLPERLRQLLLRLPREPDESAAALLRPGSPGRSHDFHPASAPSLGSLRHRAAASAGRPVIPASRPLAAGAWPTAPRASAGRSRRGQRRRATRRGATPVASASYRLVRTALPQSRPLQGRPDCSEREPQAWNADTS
ncbi:unnamed protein product [Polarella glacialis]|uniref:Uncharacterized protein n=1 Tax=Polarella glacialis TaxID=89957 RepID=A0A813ELL4_POLGL|nr:unnamed protein product [Polarella glacialis]